jgi:hypothetical protein
LKLNLLDDIQESVNQMTAKIKVTIDRARWRTGSTEQNKTGKGYTRLLNKEGFMCCLGFCCQAAGASDADLQYKLYPSGLANTTKNSVPRIRSLIKYDSRLGRFDDSDLSVSAMEINDCRVTTAPEKEEKLLELFKDSEFEIEFTGEYPIIPSPDSDTSRKTDKCAL